MFRYQRSARAKGANSAEAVQFAKQVADYINSRAQGGTVQVFTEVFGDTNTFYWYTDFQDLATYEAALTRLLADQQYWDMLTKAGVHSSKGVFTTL